MALTSWLDSMFMCPLCAQLFFNEDSVVYDEIYDDSICWHCAGELEQERKTNPETFANLS